jgi:hypothetical protein
MREGYVGLLLAVAAFGCTAGAASAEPIQIEFGNAFFAPGDVTSDFVQGSTFEWNRIDPGPDYHSVTSDDGLFDSGNPSGFTQFDLVASAGAYPYHCQLHGLPGGGMAGVVRVKPVASVTDAGTFRVTWADTETTTGRRYDARYKRQGRAGWEQWLRGSTKTSGEFADGNGRLVLRSGKTYLVEVRSKGGGSQSGWSPPLSVVP